MKIIVWWGVMPTWGTILSGCSIRNHGSSCKDQCHFLVPLIMPRHTQAGLCLHQLSVRIHTQAQDLSHQSVRENHSPVVQDTDWVKPPPVKTDDTNAYKDKEQLRNIPTTETKLVAMIWSAVDISTETEYGNGLQSWPPLLRMYSQSKVNIRFIKINFYSVTKCPLSVQQFCVDCTQLLKYISCCYTQREPFPM